MTKMTRLEVLFDEIDEEGIFLRNQKINGTKAFSVKYREVRGIAYDNSQMDNSAEAYVVLTHEYLHHEENAMNHIADPVAEVHHTESYIRGYELKRLVPLDDLKGCLEKGLVDLWEIAEELEITEAVLKKAIEKYRNEGYKI